MKSKRRMIRRTNSNIQTGFAEEQKKYDSGFSELSENEQNKGFHSSKIKDSTTKSNKTSNVTDWIKRKPGRPPKERVISNNDTLQGSFINNKRKEGGGSVIEVVDTDENFTTNIIEPRSSQITKLDLEEKGGIIKIESENRYGKKEASFVSQVPHDIAFSAKLKQGQLFNDIKKKDVKIVKEKYSLADLRSFAENYNIKSTNRNDEKGDLIRKLKKVFEQKEETNSNTLTEDDFQKDLKTQYDIVNTEERRGGMIPLEKVGPILEQKDYSKQQINDYLFDLEKKRVIELQIASDPKMVDDKTYSINHPSRGLINYVVWRNNISKNKSPSSFNIDVKKDIDRINFEDQRGGVIPLYRLGPELEKQGYSKSEIKENLFRLEKDNIIDLQSVSDPSLVKEQNRTWFFDKPPRRNIAFVVWRK